MLIARKAWHTQSAASLWRIAAIGLAVLAPLLVRLTPPAFHIPGTHSRITACTQQEHRQSFDYGDEYCTKPQNEVLLPPPPQLHPDLNSHSEPALQLPSKGLHYNRPPPAIAS